MKPLITLLVVLLGCALPVLAQRPNLQQKVTVQYSEASLNQVITDLQQKYRVRFSYANNLIPLGQNITFSAKNQPLKTVLDGLFRDLSVSYQVVGDQVVLIQQIKPKSEVKIKEGVVEKRVYQVFPIIQPDLAVTASTGKVMAKQIEVDSVPVTITKPKRYAAYALQVEDAVRKASRKVEKSMEDLDRNVTLSDLQAPNLNLSTKPRKPKGPSEPDTLSHALKLPEASGNVTGQQAKRAEEKTDSIGTNPPEKTKVLTDSADSAYKTRPVQLTFIPPLGTNGMEGGRIVNNVSINVLAGYAAGLDGVEFSGLVNVEKDYVKGGQFAGFANIVGKNVRAWQFAGFTNLNGGVTKGMQFAGFLNLTGDSAAAGQFAGVTNITNGPAKGAQFAGFLNLTKGNFRGPQAASFANFTKGSLHGAQLAGFMNLAAGNVQGAQVAGFINVARKVKGLQLGVINVADSVEGVQVGLLNFARHGYRRFEVWGSEIFYANVAYKMGTRQFYNIFALSGKTLNKDYRWAFGYGFGTEQRLSNRIGLNIDAIAWHINENRAWTDELNLLSQLRANLGFRLGKRLALFAGPTFNVYTSDLYDAERQQYGLDLAPWIAYDHQSGRTRVTMWPGLNAGIRF